MNVIHFKDVAQTTIHERGQFVSSTSRAGQKTRSFFDGSGIGVGGQRETGGCCAADQRAAHPVEKMKGSTPARLRIDRPGANPDELFA